MQASAESHCRASPIVPHHRLSGQWFPSPLRDSAVFYLHGKPRQKNGHHLMSWKVYWNSVSQKQFSRGGGCSCIWDSKCTRSLCSPLVTSIWRRSKVILSRLFNGDRNRNFEQISHAKGSKMAGLLVFPLYSLVSKTCGLRTKKSWWIFNWWRIKIMWTWIYIVLERRAWWICHPGVRPWEPCIRKTFNHWKIWVRKCRFLTLHYAMLFKKLDSVMLIIFLSGHL